MGKENRPLFPLFPFWGNGDRYSKKDLYNKNDITLPICKSQICEDIYSHIWPLLYNNKNNYLLSINSIVLVKTH